MHSTTPGNIVDPNKAASDSNDLDKGDTVVKKDPENIGGMVPDKMATHEINGNGIKAEPHDIKEEIQEEGQKMKMEPGNPGSAGNPLPNGDTDLDGAAKSEDTPASADKGKSDPNGTPKSSNDINQQNQMGPAGPNSAPAPAKGPTLSSSSAPIPNQQAPSQVEPQFMQQQSQILVFSTGLANEAAHAVQGGHYPNILSFHMDQPATKNFLQKHPVKSRGGTPGMQMYNMPGMGRGKKQNPNMNMNMAAGNQGMGGMFMPNNSSVAQWVQQQNQHLQEGMIPNNFPGGSPDPRMMYGPQNPAMMGGGGGGGGGGNFQMMMDGMFDPEFDGPGGIMNNFNLLQSKVPNENLTPEQLHRREEQLAKMRKISQMLFPERSDGQQGYPPGMMPGPGGPVPSMGMMPSDMREMPPGLMQQQQMIASKRAMMMMSQPNMPPGMMDSRQQSMMTSQEQFMMSQGMSQFGPGPLPQNMQNFNPAQREWMRLQQEFYSSKRSRTHGPHNMGPGMDPKMSKMMDPKMAQMMDPKMDPKMGQMMDPKMGQMMDPKMGPMNDPKMGQIMDPNVQIQGQPPPSYYSTIAQKRQGSIGMSSPTSPSMNGPLGSPMSAQGKESSDPFMFPGAQGRPPFSAMESAMGGMGPGMPPGGGYDQCVPQGSPLNPNMGPGPNMPSNMKTPQVSSLQRVGNPEKFQPDLALPSVTGPMSNSSSASKPPPSYAQSQSTKRKRDDMEELCKNLQPTPSPQHISYLKEFEGQELTITKQINTAYRENNSSESQSQSSHFSQNQIVNSPMHGPSSNKGPMSNSSQTSSAGGPLASPGPVPGAGPTGPGPSPISGANMRLSHYDPNTPSNSSAISTSPTTPTGKASMSNITSATLANLAKGVENLSNQMQQHMMQGGPFHSIQVQGQQAQHQQQHQNQQQQQQHQQHPPHQAPPPQQQSQQPPSQPGNPVHSSTTPHSVGSMSGNVPSLPGSQSQSTPSVNNTYVNATMSIQQLNIQSLNPANGPNYNPSMQVQQMNMEQTQQMSGMHPGSLPGDVHDSGSGIVSSASMTQQQTMMSNMRGPLVSGGKVPPFSSPPSSQMVASQQQSNSIIQSQSQSQVQGRMNSPGSSLGNASVQIQPKAPNTIQYLPAQPPANQPNMPPSNPKKPDLDFMNMNSMSRFSSPMVGLEGKVPTSKMQYFPPGHPHYQPSMGPGPGPGGGMGPGPNQMPGMRQGPDPMRRNSGPGMMQSPDPGMSAMVGPDPRMGPGPDMRMSSDPRMGPDPRMIAEPGMDPRMTVDSRMGSDPRMSSDLRLGGDPRLGSDPAMASDPRMSSDPRMGPDPRLMTDPRMGSGPRMGSSSAMGMGPGPGMGPEQIPGMGPTSDPRMGPASAGMGPSMVPGHGQMPSSGGPMGSAGPMGLSPDDSPYSGPIGPAVQQSMMMRRASPSDIPGMAAASMSAMSGMGSPGPMGHPMSMSMNNPMSSGNPMTSMSNMSRSIMNDPMAGLDMPPGSMSGGSTCMPYSSPPYPGSGGQSMMSPGQVSHMQMQNMGGPRMPGPSSSMGNMSMQGPYRQPSPGMRMVGPGQGPSMGPGPLSPGAPGYNAQYQQFQQQLYAQGRTRQMSPMDSMMGSLGPGPYMGPGPMMQGPL